MPEEGVGNKGFGWKRSIEVVVGESVVGYLLKYVLPILVMGFAASFALYFLLQSLLGPLTFLVFLFPPFFVFVVVFYPKAASDRRRVKIEEVLHLFITSMTAMSTTSISRIDVFESIAERTELGAVAEEMGKIVELVRTWNMSLDEAARFQSKRTPSPLLADFLERIAYNLGAGQSLETFLRNEQKTVMSEFEAMYRGSLDDLEVFQDLFLSMTLSVSFVVVLATIIPILTGINPNYLLIGAVMMYIFVETGFLYATSVKLPHDPVWLSSKTTFDKKVLSSIIIAAIGVVVLSLISLGDYFGFSPIQLPFNLPMAFYFAIPVTPLAYPGIIMRLEERKIKKRDKSFPSFIRSLGAAEAAKQSTSKDVLESLKEKDFGTLTEQIKNLYKRLNTRINKKLAWKGFARETRSYLVQKFSDLYYRGRDKGGDPEVLGNIIGDNFKVLLELRQKRKQVTLTFIGVIYGITGAATFAFFVGIEVVKLMMNIVDQTAISGTAGVGQLIHTKIYSIPEVTSIILLFVIANAAIASMMIKVVDGGHQINAYPHLVGLVWTGSIVSVLTQKFVSTFITV